MLLSLSAQFSISKALFVLFAVNIFWISMASFAWKDCQAAYISKQLCSSVPDRGWILRSISKALRLSLHISEWKWNVSHFVQWCVHVCSCLSSLHLFWECCWECVGWILAPSSLRHWMTFRHDVIILSHSPSQSLHTAASMRKKQHKTETKQINERLSSFQKHFFVCFHFHRMHKLHSLTFFYLLSSTLHCI